MRITALGALSMVVCLSCMPAAAAPRAELWERWVAHDPASTARIDHDDWGAFLGRYVSRDGAGGNRVAYGAVTPSDRRLLDGYIARLAATPLGRYRRDEQRAFWINLYNALTVRVVLNHYPVASIREIDISPGLFADGPWGRKLVRVAGEALSLDDIEHRILRPIWKDPRIHYALNCASVGCPNLRAGPFTGDGGEAQLDQAARAYVNHPRGVRLVGGALTVSRIYDWYSEDFGGSDAAVIAHLRRYADAALAARLDGVEEIAGYAYDWSLNDAASAP